MLEAENLEIYPVQGIAGEGKELDIGGYNKMEN